MPLAASARMLHRILALGLVVASVVSAHALTLENLRVQATLVDGSAKDPFRIRGRLGGVDAHAVVDGFATIRFGDLVAQAPAGGFRGHGSVYTWRSNLFGVKKVSINVKKGTFAIVGGGIELGDLPGPVTLAVGTSKGVACGTFDWSAAQVTAAKAGRRAVRKTATGPLESCFPTDAADHQAPTVFITSPTPLPGISTIAPTVDIAGEATDDVGVVGLTWSSDQGSGASLVPAPSWSVVTIPLVVGDNRITVTATDAAGNTGSDELDVTYNTNGIEFDGMPIASPEAVLMEDAENVQVRQKILPNPDIDPASIELVHLADDGSTTSVGVLADGGNRQNGDDLPGDDVYSMLMGLDGGADKIHPEHFRVGARTKSAPDVIAWSPIMTIARIEPVKFDAVKAAITLADNAQALFAGLLGDGVDADTASHEVAVLAKSTGALATGSSEGKLGAWWVTADGLLGGVLGYDQTGRRGGRAGVLPSRPSALPAAPHTIANATPSALPIWSEVGSRRTLILAPSFEDAEPLAVDGMLRGLTCPQYEVDTFVGADADAEHFKGLEDYGLILIASHGDTLFDALGDVYRPEWDWKSTGGQTVVLTGTTLTSLTLRRWERDLRLGRMAIFAGGRAGVLPSFFTQYSERLPASIVYVGTCRSAANASLSSALLERGAGTYLGYDGYVDSSFAGTVATDLFTKLVQGQSLAQAFAAGQSDGDTPPSTFTLDGDSALSLATGPIVNGSFEVQSGFLASVAGFDVKGDGRIIGSLSGTVDVTLPTAGQRMALVSTGLGLTTQSGSFAQTVCLPPLPPGKTKMTLQYDWNFFSEEFKEYCGSQYQDYFRVTFGGTELQKTTVDDLCYDPGTTLVHVDGMKFDVGDVWKTGWQPQSIDVTTLAGTTDVLTFAAGDVGDSIYDTVILVDNMRLVVE
jgi:hypothetical protein